LHVNGELQNHSFYCLGNVLSDHIHYCFHDRVLSQFCLIDLLLDFLHLIHLILLLKNPVLVTFNVAVDTCLFEM
jgi:hypothetical protein